MSRLFRSVRRGFELIREALDAIDPPEIGTDDDEGSWVRVESAQQVRPHVELNGCGCADCDAAVDVIRRALVAEADLRDCEAMWLA